MAIQRKIGSKQLVLISAFFLLAGLVLSCGDQKPPQAGSSIDAEKLYLGKCGICHGRDGKMQYAGAKDLSVTQLSKEEIFHQIKFGKGTMPPQKDLLTDEEIMALTEYTLKMKGK